MRPLPVQFSSLAPTSRRNKSKMKPTSTRSTGGSCDDHQAHYSVTSTGTTLPRRPPTQHHPPAHRQVRSPPSLRLSQTRRKPSAQHQCELNWAIEQRHVHLLLRGHMKSLISEPCQTLSGIHRIAVDAYTGARVLASLGYFSRFLRRGSSCRRLIRNSRGFRRP